jgi:hypothetical protein
MPDIPRDPDCECQMELPSMRRIWCDHCLTDGPKPGTLADPAVACGDDQ